MKRYFSDDPAFGRAMMVLAKLTRQTAPLPRPPTLEEQARLDAYSAMPPEHFDPPPGFEKCTRPTPHEGPCAHPPKRAVGVYGRLSDGRDISLIDGARSNVTIIAERVETKGLPDHLVRVKLPPNCFLDPNHFCSDEWKGEPIPPGCYYAEPKTRVDSVPEFLEAARIASREAEKARAEKPKFTVEVEAVFSSDVVLADVKKRADEMKKLVQETVGKAFAYEWFLRGVESMSQDERLIGHGARKFDALWAANAPGVAKPKTVGHVGLVSKYGWSGVAHKPEIVRPSMADLDPNAASSWKSAPDLARGYVAAEEACIAYIEKCEANDELRSLVRVAKNATRNAVFLSRALLAVELTRRPSKPTPKTVRDEYRRQYEPQDEDPNARAIRELSERADTRLVRELGDRIGYGRVMQLASSLWNAKNPPSSGHTVGPTLSMMVDCECVEAKRSPANCDWCCGVGRVTERVRAEQDYSAGKVYRVEVDDWHQLTMLAMVLAGRECDSAAEKRIEELKAKYD